MTTGRILTNYHVAGRAAEIYVTLFNKERVPAKLDRRRPLDGPGHRADGHGRRQEARTSTSSTPSWATSSTLIPGQDVMAIGTPFGLARTMTLGIVSNNERTFYPDRMTIDEYETGEFANWIQMDTPINPGNSGGPLVDMTGKVVGINTRGGGQNLNFAVPIDTAKEVVSQILASADAGQEGPRRAQRPRASISSRCRTWKRSTTSTSTRACWSTASTAARPPTKAGVKTQDILLEINGKPINVRFPEEVAAGAEDDRRPADRRGCRAHVRRGKETQHIKATPGKLTWALGKDRPPRSGAWRTQRSAKVRQREPARRRRRRLDHVAQPGLRRRQGRLHIGDVIRSVNLKPVKDVDEFVRLYNESVRKQEPKVIVEVSRNRGRQTAVLKVTY